MKFFVPSSLLTCIVAIAAATDCLKESDIVVDDVVPPSTFDLFAQTAGAKVVMDIYDCQENNASPEVLVFTPGASSLTADGVRTGKLGYKMMAQKLAEKGYLVALAEKIVTFGPTTLLNFFAASDYDRVIQFLGNPDTVYVGGHSFGGSQALYRLDGRDAPTFFFPGAPLAIPTNPAIKGAISYGTFCFLVSLFRYI